MSLFETSLNKIISYSSLHSLLLGLDEAYNNIISSSLTGFPVTQTLTFAETTFQNAIKYSYSNLL